MTADEKKRRAAQAALAYVEADSVIGVGTGSTVRHFIDALASMRGRIEGAVPSSEATAAALREARIPLVDLNSLHEIPVYVDGADEATRHLQLIKGGGGALTREKICAAASRRFVCIADDSKLVDVLGTFPVAVEVIPMARSYVARQLVKLGGTPELRTGFTTDNGNVILDVRFPPILDPLKLERDIDGIVGVVENGLFAHRPADVLLLGTEGGVQTIER